jgi:hypothetical protein
MRRLLFGVAALAVLLGIGAYVFAEHSAEAARPARVVVGSWEVVGCDRIIAHNIVWSRAGGTRQVVLTVAQTSPSKTVSYEEGVRFDKPKRGGLLHSLKLTSPTTFDGGAWTAQVRVMNTGGKTITVSTPTDIVVSCP